MNIGNHLFAETILVFGTIQVGIDLGVEALLLQDGEVVQHLSLVLGSPAEQMLKVQLDEAVGIGALKELRLVQPALGHLAHELPHAQVATLEQRLRTLESLRGHHVLVAEHLTINSTD